MAQHFADLNRWHAGANHLTGGRVAQLMRPNIADPGATRRSQHQACHPRAGQCDPWRERAHEHFPRRRGWPTASQLSRHRLATSTGSGSRSVRLPLPLTVITPARQSMSSSLSVATSLARIPKRIISSIAA